MKKILVLIAFLLATPAYAGVPCALPFNLQNSTLADATQVMANYNALVSCLLNAAAAGANNDITSLLGLTTPLNATSGGAQTYTTPTPSSGSPNSQSLTGFVPAGLTLRAGIKIRFIPGFTNTGPMVISSGVFSNINVYRVINLNTGGGAFIPAPMAGGEVVFNAITELIYDGTEFVQLTPPNALIPPGHIDDFVGVNPPFGWLVADGSCVSQSTYAALFAQTSTNYGSCGAGLFALPDLRGRVTVAYDSQGTQGPANRITVTTSGCAATTVGVGCGNQGLLLAQNQLPVVSLATTAVNNVALNNGPNTNQNIVQGNGVSTQNVTAGTNNYTVIQGVANSPAPSFSVNIPSTAVPLNVAGLETPIVTLQPLLTVLKAVKY